MSKPPDLKIAQLHARNKHQGRYDFDQLIEVNPSLSSFVKLNEFNDKSIDFANAEAVKILNRTLLAKFYGISNWDIPKGYLCPPIPGRADYIHYIADLLGKSTSTLSKKIRVLDIGVGANAIYPLIGFREYGWHFVGTDIDITAINNAQHILDNNIGLAEAITLRLQIAPKNIFKNIILANNYFDVTMCNPPFHASFDDLLAGTRRKWQNLGISQTKNTAKLTIVNKSNGKLTALNFGGQATELYCSGGEEAFINCMINESTLFKNQCYWFTTLVSKAATLPAVYRALKKANVLQVKTIEMAQGQKKSRIVAWSFLSAQQQILWHK